MSIQDKGRNSWVIVISFIFAFVLSIIPLPLELQAFMPEWIMLVLIYWCMALPHRVGIGIGWFLGLLLDVLRDTLLGQYALTLAIIAFVTLHLHQRIRVVPLWQQSISIFLITLLATLIIFWIKGIQGIAPEFWMIIISPIAGAIVWPGIFLLMRNVRRYYQVN